MKQNTSIWLERLLSLRSSLQRKAAAAVGLQFTHAEILDYLSKCNRYSNSALALTEYLGLTKGSLSQSLKLLESKGLIKRTPCADDKRIARLSLTVEGTAILASVSAQMPDLSLNDSGDEAALQHILSTWQHQHGLKGFGLCGSCRYNQTLDAGNPERLAQAVAGPRAGIATVAFRQYLADRRRFQTQRWVRPPVRKSALFTCFMRSKHR